MSNGQKIIDGLVDAVAHANGDLSGVHECRVRVPDSINVRAIRQKLGLTQRQFAIQFGFSLATLRNWEQGTRIPPGTSRILLTVIDRAPDVVKKVLEEAA